MVNSFVYEDGGITCLGASREGNDISPVIYMSRKVKEIIPIAPLVKKIVFNNGGEIELRACSLTKLIIYSKTRLANGELKITHITESDITSGYSPEFVLQRAENAIYERIMEKEMEDRQNENSNYRRSKLSLVKPSPKANGLLDPDEIAKSYLRSRGKAV